MSKSPAAIVKEQFGDKAKLVAALGPFLQDELWVQRVNEAKGLARVSNAKLLKLYGVFKTVKEKFGSRAKLVDEICQVEKRAKDQGYKDRLLAYPVPRLYDLYRASSKRVQAATKAATPTKKPVAAKKPAAVAAPAAKKAPAKAKAKGAKKKKK